MKRAILGVEYSSASSQRSDLTPMSFHVLIGRLELKYSSKIVTKLTDNLYKGPSPGLSNSSYSQDFLNFNPFVSGL